MAATMKKRVIIPGTKNLPEEQLGFCLALKEALRIEHNIEGAKFRNQEITQNQWDTYQESFFSRHNGLTKKILELRANIVADGLDAVDLEGSFEDDA